PATWTGAAMRGHGRTCGIVSFTFSSTPFTTSNTASPSSAPCRSGPTQSGKAKALADYKRALALGGSRPLPDLFSAAGCRFDFSAKTVKPLVALVRQELAKLD